MAYEQSLGIDFNSLVEKVGPAVQAASKVVADPALPEVTCHVLRLNRVTEGLNPGAPCVKKKYSVAEKKQGIGLHLATQPLRIAVWAKQHPSVAIGVGLGLVGVIWGVGYTMGRRR